MLVLLILKPNKVKPKLIILIGPPCTGKSTWSRDYVKAKNDTLRFNRDEIRLMLAATPMLDTLGEHVVTRMIDEGIHDALTSGRDAILDQTNCKLKYVMKYVNLFSEYSDIKFKVFHIELLELLHRNVHRANATGIRRIPEEIIINMHTNQKKMLESVEFKRIIEKYEYLV